MTQKMTCSSMLATSCYMYSSSFTINFLHPDIFHQLQKILDYCAIALYICISPMMLYQDSSMFPKMNTWVSIENKNPILLLI